MRLDRLCDLASDDTDFSRARQAFALLNARLFVLFESVQ